MNTLPNFAIDSKIGRVAHVACQVVTHTLLYTNKMKKAVKKQSPNDTVAGFFAHSYVAYDDNVFNLKYAEKT